VPSGGIAHDFTNLPAAIIGDADPPLKHIKALPAQGITVKVLSPRRAASGDGGVHYSLGGLIAVNYGTLPRLASN